MMSLKERFSKLVDVNGKEYQFEQAIEEASEFIQAVQKMKREIRRNPSIPNRTKASVEDVIGEMADVLVTFGCLKDVINRDHDEPFYVEKIIDDVMNQKTAWVEKYDGKSDTSLTWQDFK